jgi:hypothetical protein
MSSRSPTHHVREEGFRRMVSELRRLRRRALARPILVGFLAVLATTGAVVRQALHKQSYEASVSFRVVERLEAFPGKDVQPRTRRRLREYVYEAIFTRQRCRELVEKYDLYPAWTAIDVSRGVDLLRNTIDIKVSQNYFLRESWGDTTPRSARIRISYEYTDVDVAAAVVEDLGLLVQTHEAAVRREIARLAAREAELIDRRTNQRIDALRRKLARAQLELREAGNHRRAVLQVEIAKTREALERSSLQLESLRRERSFTELQAGLEKNQLLLSFYKTDENRSPPPRIQRSTRLIIVAVIVFFLFLPICGIAVAAFDPVVYTAEDLNRLGLRPLARLRAIGPAGYGSLRDRLSRPTGETSQ